MEGLDVNSLIDLMGEFSSEDKNNTYDKLIRYTNVFNKINSVKSNFPYDNDEEKEEAEKRSKLFLSKYNEKIEARGLKNLHKILPYLDTNYQKSFAIFTKVIEVNILQELLQDAEINRVSENAYSKDLLSVLMENISTTKKGKIDNFLQILSLKDIFAELNNNIFEEYDEQADEIQEELVHSNENNEYEIIDLEGDFL